MDPRPLFKPRKLQAGDHVSVITPASPVRKEMFDQGISVLRGLGFEVKFGNVFEKWRYLAGDDSHRSSQLQAALDDPESRAIFFARGGYGSLRLLRNSHSIRMGGTPQVLFGCSDVTTLHQYFQRMHGWVVFHGPMPSGDFARGQLHIRSFRSAVMESDPYVLQPEGVEALVQGTAEGKLTGGCLSMLHACLSTPWEPNWDDAIVFLEDVAVKPYQVDRMLTHLRIAGKLNKVRAFIFGEMNDCVQVENQGYTLQEVILDVLEGLNVPVFFGFPSGHVRGLNWTLPLGVRARVGSHPEFHLEILEEAVE